MNLLNACMVASIRKCPQEKHCHIKIEIFKRKHICLLTTIPSAHNTNSLAMFVRMSSRLDGKSTCEAVRKEIKKKEPAVLVIGTKDRLKTSDLCKSDQYM